MFKVIGKKMIVGILVLCVVLSATIRVNADGKNQVVIDGTVYEFLEDSDLKANLATNTKKSADATTLGKLKIVAKEKRKIEPLGSEGKNQYTTDVTDEEFGIKIIYSDIRKQMLEKSETDWYLSSSSVKKVFGEGLDNKVKMGAFIVDASLDGKIWNKVEELTDVFDDFNDELVIVYKVNPIQLSSGCHFRIRVIYEEERVVGKRRIGSKTSSQQIVEEYEFYIENDLKEQYSVDNNGFFWNVSQMTDKKDYNKTTTDTKYNPHAEFILGSFSMNGYTEVVESNSSCPKFTKSVGDRIVLGFNLKKDINKLRDDGSLYVNYQKKGTDSQFNLIDKVFKRGTLIIRHKEPNNTLNQPITYTDFLAACCSTSADTKIVLYEEGTYEVALDYELIDTKKTPDKKTHYRISFTFQIVNNGSSLYIMNLNGSELTDNDWVEDGFKVNFAKNQTTKCSYTQYKISYDSKKNSVHKTEIKSGLLGEGAEKTETGVYCCKSNNEYTQNGNLDTGIDRTVYVGNDKYIIALSSYKLPLDEAISELNKDLANGAKIQDDGTIKK